MRPNAAPAYRKKLIQMIHVAKRDLALDDATYRAILMATTGVESSKSLSIQDLEQMLDKLKSKGFVVRAGKDGPPVTRLDNDPQAKMIRALWLRLHELGEVRNPSEQALAAFIKRHTGVDRLEWLNTAQASSVIEHLKKWLARIGDCS
ncbi:MAG: gp16 family protein [Desulfovibrionaceae bacterium]